MWVFLVLNFYGLVDVCSYKKKKKSKKKKLIRLMFILKKKSDIAFLKLIFY